VANIAHRGMKANGRRRYWLACDAAFALLMVLALAGANAHAAQWFVQTDNVAFSPQFLTIGAGDSVTFLNRGGYHNVVADDGSFRCAHGCDGDGKGGSGNASSSLWIVTRVFSEPGTVGYFCEPHGSPGSGMFGTIEVQAPVAPATPAPVGSVLLDLALGAGLVVLAALRLRRKDARQSPFGH
jgi:plastocyanin